VAVTEQELQALVGYRFPGGTVTIAHWENVLLSDVMGVPPLPDGLVHPAALFHVSVAGAGLGIGEIFELFRAESDEAVRGGEFHWVFHDQLREGTPYDAAGEVVSVERKVSRKLGPMDAVTFRFELCDAATGAAVAEARPTWLFLRTP
jgi:hypothetical protein